MVHLVNQERKEKQKGKRKMSETQNKSYYEIIHEPIILLSDTFFANFGPTT